MIVYHNGNFLSKEDVRISPDDRGFLLGDGAYEVIRAYGGKLFKPGEHLRRMERSLRELRIAGPDVQALGDVARELLRRNQLEKADAALYLQITRGAAPRKHAFPEPGVPPTVYLSATAFRGSQVKWEQGVKIILVPDVRWARCDIKSVALVPNVLASQRAKECGAEEAVFVRDGSVTEGAHTNFCAVFSGRLVTHPKTRHILGGVTREVVLDLCAGLDIPVTEFPILQERLREADELLIVGTTTEIMPVVTVGDWIVGDGKPGPVTRQLQRAFRGITRLPGY
jgi:D-alanine transaminase